MKIRNLSNSKNVTENNIIPNNTQTKYNPKAQSPTKRKFPIITVLVILSAVFTGFWISRFFPTNKKSTSLLTPKTNQDQKLISADNLKKAEDIKIGITYGDTYNSFKDSAIGTLIEGSINNVGTHILEREGGKSQRASLISSVLDLDLFIGRKVEIKGETNASDKTSWLLDVGSIKVLE